MCGILLYVWYPPICVVSFYMCSILLYVGYPPICVVSYICGILHV